MKNHHLASNPELDTIKQFISECIPFDQLHPKQLDAVVREVEVEYYRSGHQFHSSVDDGGLKVLRSGAAELRNKQGDLIDRIGDYDCFNLFALRREHSEITATLIEDSLIYLLPEDTYQELRKKHRGFDRFFNSQKNRRLRRATLTTQDQKEMMILIKDIMSTNIISVTSKHSIQEAAQLMTEHRVSSVMIIENNKLCGIVTDRDLRSRAITQKLSYSSPVEVISTSSPLCISPEYTLFDATLFMTRHGIHHLPVTDSQKVVGFITSSDLMLARRNDPVYLVHYIGRQTTLSGITKTISQLPDLMIQWTHAGMRATQIAHLFTAISDAVTVRLIEIFIDEHGDAPVAFSWLGFGSQGRAEQLLGGDQDNALVIDDSLSEGQAQWFERLSHWVCDGLNACGWVYCPGDVMATNKQWRQTLSAWKNTVLTWVHAPTPKASMLVSIFFDIRVIYGSKSIGDSLQQHMLNTACENTIFLAALTENALEHKPPLGIFRQFVVEHNGEHAHELDLKKRGILPIIETTRIHCLAAKVRYVNTIDRLKELANKKVLTINESRNLQDALKIIIQIRLREQVKELTQSLAPNNYIDPDNLSKLDRRRLRDAFAVIKDAQKSIQMRYRQGM